MECWRLCFRVGGLNGAGRWSGSGVGPSPAGFCLDQLVPVQVAFLLFNSILHLSLMCMVLK